MRGVAGKMLVILLAYCWLLEGHAHAQQPSPWPLTRAAATTYAQIQSEMLLGHYAAAAEMWENAAQKHTDPVSDQSAFLLGLANQQRLRGKFDASFQIYRSCQIHFLRQDPKNVLLRAQIVEGYADLAVELTQTEPRKKTIQACIAVFQAMDSTSAHRSVLARKIASLLRLVKEQSEAARWLAIAQSAPQGDCSEQLRLQNEVAYAKTKAGDYETAHTLLEEANQKMVDCPNLMPEDWVQHYFNVSEYWDLMSDSGEVDLNAEEMSENALAAAMELEKKYPEICPNLLYACHDRLAMRKLEMGDAIGAESIAKRGLAGQKARNINPRGISQAYNGLARIYHYLGRSDDAVDGYEQARLTYPQEQRQGNLNYFDRLHNLAQELINNRQYEKGEKLMQEAREALLSFAPEDYYRLAMIEQNIGIGHDARHQYQESVPRLQTALALHLKAPKIDWYSVCSGRIFLATGLEALGDHEAAQEQVAQCIVDLSRIPSNQPMERAMVLEVITDYYRLKHEFDEALKINHRFVREMVGPSVNPDPLVCPELDHSVSPWHTLFAASQKANILLGLYDQTDSIPYLQASLECAQKALKRLRKLRQEQNNEQEKLRINEEWTTLFDNAMHASMELFAQTHDSCFLHTAFEISEQSKAMLLMEAVLNNSVLENETSNANLVAERQKIQARIFRLRKAINAADAPPRVISKLHDDLFAAEKQLDDVMQRIKAANPQYTQIVNAFDVVTVADLQPILAQTNRALVEYFYSDSAIYVFAVTPHAFLAHTFVPDRYFSEQLDSFALSLHTAPVLTDEVQARRYGMRSKLILDAIWRPIASSLPRRVTIVPDGPLNLISFEALADTVPDKTKVKFSDIGYLIEDFTISYDYSGTFLAQQPPNDNSQTNAILGMAPSFANHPNLMPLPESREGVRLLGEAYPSAKALLDNAATKKAFLDLAKHYQIVDLATHGTYDRKNFLNSRIYFSPDGSGDSLLYLYDLYTQNLPLRLAILEACETGLGDYHQGEGVMSMARAFTYAGCKSVLMSLWEVPEGNTTKGIMQGFYANLADSLPLDEAIAVAKRNYLSQLREEGGYNMAQVHPFYWSELVLIGANGQLPIDKPSTSTTWIWLVVAVVVGLAIAAYLVWRKERLKANLASPSQ